MKYTSAQIINSEFYIDFIDMLATTNGKKSIEKLEWFLGLDGFDKDPYVNAYRTGASELLALIKKWGDPQFSKQLEKRREIYDRGNHESSSRGELRGKQSGAGKSDGGSGSRGNASKSGVSSAGNSDSIVVR